MPAPEFQTRLDSQNSVWMCKLAIKKASLEESFDKETTKKRIERFYILHACSICHSHASFNCGKLLVPTLRVNWRFGRSKFRFKV